MAALLPGQSPPATVITPYDHRGWIYIAGSVSLCLLLISLALRLHIRIRVRPPFGHDDTVLIVSTVRDMPSHADIRAELDFIGTRR